MIQKHLSNVRIQWMTFMRILIINTQAEKKKFAFDDMIADFMTNKKFQAIIKELFIRCRKNNILVVFITQSKFKTLFDYQN